MRYEGTIFTTDGEEHSEVRDLDDDQYAEFIQEMCYANAVPIRGEDGVHKIIPYHSVKQILVRPLSG